MELFISDEKNLTMVETAELIDAAVLEYLLFIYCEKNIQFILKGYILSFGCFFLRRTSALYQGSKARTVSTENHEC